MSILTLITTETFNNLPCNFYRNIFISNNIPTHYSTFRIAFLARNLITGLYTEYLNYTSLYFLA